MEWDEYKGAWLLRPSRALGIIHFVGGAFVAAAPQVTYRRLLEFLAKNNYVVIATPFLNTLDHTTLAAQALRQFNTGLDYLEQRHRLKRFLPIYGLGHSMGCKLHLLMTSLYGAERAGNIFLAFNNYSASQSIPFMESVLKSENLRNLRESLSTTEFSPSPRETERMIHEGYRVRRNLLIRFQNDDIDQTPRLIRILEQRSDFLITSKRLAGNHLTPLGQDWSWQPGQDFSPLDAVGQWLRQNLFTELHQLEQEIIHWLEPVQQYR